MRKRDSNWYLLGIEDIGNSARYQYENVLRVVLTKATSLRAGCTYESHNFSVQDIKTQQARVHEDVKTSG